MIDKVYKHFFKMDKMELAIQAAKLQKTLDLINSKNKEIPLCPHCRKAL